MIQIGIQFIKAFTPNEQLIMLRLLLNADNNGVVEFSDRNMSRLTEIPYQQVRTIHKHWLSDGTLTNAHSNASANANQCLVSICDYDSYCVFNIISNAVTNAVINALTEQERNNENNKVSPHTPLQTTKENNKEKDVEEKPSNEGKKKNIVYPEDYEKDFALYGRKGSKKNGYERWKTLTDEDKDKMSRHIPFYLCSNDRQYLKDFEGYINQRMFESPVYRQNQLLYDPSRVDDTCNYHPLTDGMFQVWMEKEKYLRFDGQINSLNDGYTADTRPDGATVGWQMYRWVWSKDQKRWNKK